MHFTAEQSRGDAVAVSCKAAASLGTRVLGGLFFLWLLVTTVGLGIICVQRTREAMARIAHETNLGQIGKGLHSCAANTPSKGYIPPANGQFPPDTGPTGSFFYHLLPFIEQGALYASPADRPVKWYIEQWDARNSGKDSTISYATNGVVFEAKEVRLPDSFFGRSSGTICVMQRSGLDGAHKWTNTNNVLGSPGNPPPFPQFDADPRDYLEDSPQALYKGAAEVLMGDGSTRVVRPVNQPAWNWGCDPKDQARQPPEW
jgi:hypothetical protein